MSFRGPSGPAGTSCEFRPRHPAIRLASSRLRRAGRFAHGEPERSALRLAAFAGSLRAFSLAANRRRCSSADAGIPNAEHPGADASNTWEPSSCYVPTPQWVVPRASCGKGKASDLEADLRAHLLPSVTIVPAMVIAIEKAQAAGIATTDNSVETDERLTGPRSRCHRAARQRHHSQAHRVWRKSPRACA
jgi:hypothetical protein